MFYQLFTILLLIAIFANGSSQQTSKIEPNLLKVFQNEPTSKVNIFVKMREGNGATLRRIDSLRISSRTEKISTMKTQLESLAATSQKGIHSILEEEKADYHSFWINNQMFVRDATLELVQKLEKDPEVSLIFEEPVFHLPPLSTPSPSASTTNDNQVLWNIEKIEAPQAWSMNGGNRGEGVVVAVIDSGVRYTHQWLRGNYREEYGWFDPYTLSSTPSDSDGHGTHVTGTIVGSNGIGVAPGAEWIACRGCGTEAMCQGFAVIICGEWIVCPTDPKGENENCSMAPHISSNSWGALGESWELYGEVVDAWQSAGIIPVFAIGNSGPNCSTTVSPGNLDNVIGVGATDKTDTVSGFSRLGPTSKGQVKPDISAPGSEILSASKTGDDVNVTMQGTSMACPHVSGAVALLLSRKPSLSYEEIKNLLQYNSERNLGNEETCGGTPPNQFPNNVYGYGRINVRKALEALIGDNSDSAANPPFIFNIGVLMSFTLLTYFQSYK